ncbi:MAG: amidohydrolase family protein [Firmicutes bacterium]|nr:amidohydrolase family protein [Bacillota bacterium]
MGKYLIKGARYVLTMDRERTVYTDGAVLVDGDRIVQVGKSAELAARVTPDTEVIDARDKLLMPGLINAHLHLTQLHIKGCTTDFFTPSLIPKLHLLEHTQDEEAAYYSALCSCIEALKTGTTAFADPGGYATAQMVQAVDVSGLRAVISRSLADFGTVVEEPTDQAIQAGKEFVEQYQGAAGGRVKAWLSLRTERMVSNELCRRIQILAQELGVGIQSHVASCRHWIDVHKEAFRGLTPVERFHRSGLLGPNLLLTHCNFLTAREADLLREHDVRVCHCPTSGFILGMGTLHGRHVEMYKDGVCLSIGSDNAGASNFHDMFRVMYALTAHRDHHYDACVFSPEDILDICIVNGARALLWEEEIGSLEPGKMADLILLDLNRPEWLPVLNPVNNLVHCATGESVDTVMVGGKILMQGRRVLFVDEAEVLAKTQEAGLRAAEKAGLLKTAAMRWPVR